MSDLIVPPIDLPGHPKEKTITKTLIADCRREVDDLLQGLSVAPKNEKTLFICGSNSVGKSTLARKFVSDPAPDRESPTLTTRYYYGIRKPTAEERENNPHDDEHKVSNIWEASSGPLFMIFLECIEVGPELSVVLMVDLSEPKKIWESIEPVLKGVQAYIEKARDDKLDLKEASMRRMITDDHVDLPHLKPFDAPLIIVGGKYDLFEKFPSEDKRIICSCLRFIAHHYCAYLLFYSDLNPSLVKATRDVLNLYAYDVKMNRKITPVVDYESPLHIPPGADSLASIQACKSISTMEECHKLLDSRFPQEKIWVSYSELTKEEDSFREPSIDNLRKLKNDDIRERIREIDNEILSGRIQHPDANLEFDVSDSEYYDTASPSSQEP